MTAYRTLGRYGLALAMLSMAPSISAGETVVSLDPAAKEKILEEAAARNAGRIGEPSINGTGPRIHGQVGMRIGTNGARGVHMSMAAPIGQNAGISLAFERTRFGSR